MQTETPQTRSVAIAYDVLKDSSALESRVEIEVERLKSEGFLATTVQTQRPHLDRLARIIFTNEVA